MNTLRRAIRFSRLSPLVVLACVVVELLAHSPHAIAQGSKKPKIDFAAGLSDEVRNEIESQPPGVKMYIQQRLSGGTMKGLLDPAFVETWKIGQVGIMRGGFGALGGAQFGGAGARVARIFLRVGDDGTLGQSREAGGGVLDMRQMARAAARFAARHEKRFDDAVLERMKRHDDKAAAGFENALAGGQRAGQFAEFVIDENAQRLKGARRRVNLVWL